MKAFIKPALVAFLFLVCSGNIWGQSPAGKQAYHVHEDVVLPSMAAEYEKVAKEFIGSVRKHNLPGTKWVSTQTNDLRYLYVRPIAGMADLDNNKFWKELHTKMGDNNLPDLLGRMDKCYDTHFDYVLTLDNELSYMPGGITQTPAGQDYRRFYYLYTTPQNEEKLVKSMKAVKAMFEQKGSKMDYRVYSSGFGVKGSYFMVATAAKDAAAYEEMDAANNKLLGDEGGKIFGEMMQHVSRYEEVSGRMRPDLAYTPQ